jgi:hypothetical protein
VLLRARSPPTRLAGQRPSARRAGSGSCICALTRYRDSDQVLRTLGEDAYAAGLAARNERLRKARLQLAALRDAHFIYTLPPLAELERDWIGMDDHERRELIAQVIDCVFVAAGRLQIEERVTICRAGKAPELPRVTGSGGEARPFTAQARHRIPQPKLWSTGRIERDLADYLRDKRLWPTADQFAAAGRRRLHDQIVRHAGIACWAHHFGLPILFAQGYREPWTEQRIRVALELYLRRKRRFPSEGQFHADGLRSLRRAVKRHGGVGRWSAELDKPLTPHQRARARTSHH